MKIITAFLKSLEKYSEKSMKIVFDNTHFMEEFYYDFKKKYFRKIYWNFS